MNFESSIPLEHSKKPLGTEESIKKSETGPGIKPAVVGTAEHLPPSEQTRIMYSYLRKPSEEAFNLLLAAAAADYNMNQRQAKLPDTGDVQKDLKLISDIVRPFTYAAIKDKQPTDAAVAYAEFLDQFTNAIRADAKRKEAGDVN